MKINFLFYLFFYTTIEDDGTKTFQSIDSTMSNDVATVRKNHQQLSSIHPSSISDVENSRPIYKKCVIQPKYSRISDSFSALCGHQAQSTNEIAMEKNRKYGR